MHGDCLPQARASVLGLECSTGRPEVFTARCTPAALTWHSEDNVPEDALGWHRLVPTGRLRAAACHLYLVCEIGGGGAFCV